jgi:hypothetical protein
MSDIEVDLVDELTSILSYMEDRITYPPAKRMVKATFEAMLTYEINPIFVYLVDHTLKDVEHRQLDPRDHAEHKASLLVARYLITRDPDHLVEAWANLI